VVDGNRFIDFDISVRAHFPLSRRVTVFVHGGAKFRWFRRQLALPLFEWGLNQLLFDQPHQYFILHAAVVERNGRAAILPAPPGSGKSTLCAALVHRGWRLLSDEATLVRLADGKIAPNPRPIGLKGESISTIRRFAPSAVLGPSWSGTPKGIVAHVRPPAESVRRADEMAQPAWLIFPQFRAGALPTSTYVSKSRGLLRAAENSFNYNVLGRRGFEALAELVNACDCYEFSYSDLEAAVAWFDQLASSKAFTGGRQVELVN
jgi:HprK-related kinase A